MCQYTNIILVRHGQSISNTKSVAAGEIDEGLSALGLEQAKLLGKFLRKREVATIYSSEKKRAIQTANEILNQQNLEYSNNLQLKTLHELREINHGIYEGLGKKAFQELSLKDYKNLEEDPANFSPPKGESGKEVFLRMKKVINELASKHLGETIVLISHGFFIATAVAYGEGKTENKFDRFLLANSSMSELKINDKGHVILLYADNCSHLPPTLQSPSIENRGRFAKLNLK